MSYELFFSPSQLLNFCPSFPALPSPERRTPKTECRSYFSPSFFPYELSAMSYELFFSPSQLLNFCPSFPALPCPERRTPKTECRSSSHLLSFPMSYQL
ncbi:hypothetical protein D1AOALGA4SA_1544 [Olavius algarvensis Delta 1 endosymbiont]|nr:hypothetical protein D1AOALGA4SA_1544 [Olavius algarvensis Delta 1 endosymbiont]